MLLDPRRASAGVMICEDMNPDPFGSVAWFEGKVTVLCLSDSFVFILKDQGKPCNFLHM